MTVFEWFKSLFKCPEPEVEESNGWLEPGIVTTGEPANYKRAEILVVDDPKETDGFKDFKVKYFPDWITDFRCPDDEQFFHTSGDAYKVDNLNPGLGAELLIIDDPKPELTALTDGAFSNEILCEVLPPEPAPSEEYIFKLEEWGDKRPLYDPQKMLAERCARGAIFEREWFSPKLVEIATHNYYAYLQEFVDYAMEVVLKSEGVGLGKPVRLSKLQGAQSAVKTVFKDLFFYEPILETDSGGLKLDVQLKLTSNGELAYQSFLQEKCK